MSRYESQSLRRSLRTTAVLSALGALLGTQVAIAGPGIAPVYSANAAPYPAPPDTFSQTYYANSPLGLRTDLVANPLNPIAPPTIDTGTALRKFVDILPGINALAPTTNIGTGTTGASSKYIPIAVPGTWPTDGADYYHIAVVEYTEQMHSDLPKGAVLRGYVQIEEPGATTTATGSKHIPLTYPNGTAITLPDASGVQQQVYAYDNPHYLGPAVVATKGKPTRVKYSNLLPVGDATGVDPWGNPLGNGVANRNGDLPLPVDATLPGGALPQNRIDIHMHGGFTPWISDGTPHQWTMPVGDDRYSYLSDIAVTAAGTGYTAPVVTIDPPQVVATAAALVGTGASAGTVSAIEVTNPGAWYSSTNPPVVTIAPPTGTGATAATSATATATLTGGAVSAISLTNVGNGYATAPLVAISAPPPSAGATGTASVSAGTVSAITVGAGGSGYQTAPTVTLSPPSPAIAATGTASVNAATGAVSAISVNGNNFGYWTAPSVSVAPPPATVQATATASVASANGAIGSVSVASGNYGYFTVPTVTVDAPPSAVPATGTAAVSPTSGSVSAVTVATGNFGYWTAPTVALSAPATAVPASATAALGTGAAAHTVASATVSPTGNFGYWAATPPSITVSAPPAAVAATGTATVSATNGAVSAIAVNTGNFGYWAAPSVTVAAPPAATSESGTVAISSTGVPASAGTLNGVGFGYWAAPRVTVAAPPARVNATATLSGSLSATGAPLVTGATLNANFGYWTAPTVTVSAPPATTQARATVTTAGVVTLGTPGFGYWTAPTVTITGGTVTTPGTAWTATAAVSGGRITSITVTPGTTVYRRAPTLTIGAPTAGTAATATATVANGMVTGITLSGGSGYSALPTVRIAAGTNGTTATATATVANGIVTGVTVTGGTGYNPSSPPALTFSAPTAGTQATATATINAVGAVTGYTVAGGRGYNPANPPVITVAAPTPSVTAQVVPVLNNGSITALAVTPGANYLTAPTVTISAPTPSVQATATPVIANGVVTGITVSGGTNYNPASPPTVTIGAPTAGTKASATASIANGTVIGVNVTGGTGYNPASPPAITIGAATPGTPATATAVLANGSITAITLSGGSGYNPVGAAPVVTISAPAASVAATATATISNGAVTGFTVNGGSNYLSAPTVTISSPAPSATATATAALGANGVVSGITITNPGSGYTSVPSVTLTPAPTATQAQASALLDANGSVIGFTITNAGSGYTAAPAVSISWPANAVQATATATQIGGSLSSVTLTNIGRGYLQAPKVAITDPAAAATGGAISSLVQMPVGPAFRNVPDMAGNLDPSKVPAGYVAPITGEGTLYYTNQQSERLMWYHDHVSGITRLNVYEGLAAPYLLVDPAVDPAFPAGPLNPTGAGSGSALDTYVPREQIAMVLQDKTFVPKDIAQEDQNWDTTGHWGTYGDLWYPHVYETNQNPAFLHSLSNLGRWDWGPWFAIVYPSLYALPSGKYGDVTLTPEAYMDTSILNGTAYPELTVEPRAYRWRVLNAANDRFMSLGFYLADTTQPAAFTDTLHTNLGVTNYPEVEQFLPVGAQPQVAPGGTLTFVNQAGTTVTEPVAPNVFQTQTAALTPWPMDGGAAGPGANHIVPAPTTMGPPIISIGNEGGLLPRWVQHDPVPVSYDYNRRSATVLNTSQNNDYTQQCFPECHGLYIGPAERADFVVDFAPYAGKTLILYNDAPAPNPGYDTRIDYYTGNDPSGNLNYMTGGAPSTLPGYGPSTRTMMQVVVKATISTPLDYTKATKPMPAQYASWNPAAAGLTAWNPNALGGGAVLGVTQDASGANCQVPGAPAIAGGLGSTGTASTCVPGVIQQTYSATQGAPIVGESAYNIAFNPTTQAVNAANKLVTSGGGYVDEYANMYLGSQNQPEFYVTNPGPLTLTGLALTGQTSTTSAASGVGVGSAASGTNNNAGAGTGYYTVPGVVISPPTACTPSTATTQNSACVQASGHATIGDGGDPTLCGTGTLPACNNVPKGQVASVALDNPGAGYTEVPSVLIVSGGSVNAVSVTNPGAGYPASTTLPVSFSAPACVNQATTSGTTTTTSCVPATAVGYATTNANGSVASITLTSGGNNYSTPPSITIPAPSTVAASGTAAISAGAVTGVSIASGGVAAAGTVPTVSFSAPPAGAVAAITPVLVPVTLPTGVVYYGTGFNIQSPGSGYTTAPVLADACGTTATTTLNAAGGIASVTLTGIGSNCALSDAVTLSTAPVAGVQATGTAVMDTTGTIVTGVSLTNAGSGYVTAPTVTFSGGVQATAAAAVAGGGYGASAVAITSTTQIFIAPAALPGNMVPPTSNATPMTLTPAVANILGCGNTTVTIGSSAVTCTNLSGAVVGRLMNPAIQELFEPFYGRMNATLGIEMPNQSLNVQTTLPLNYVDPSTELWEFNKPVMWKITHNGVDAHPVHIHLINAQLINRVGWDGTIKQPEDDEIGWKEVIKMNPLEDIILAMVPTQPPTPFGIDRSVRAQDPSQPLGVNMGFTQYSVEGFNGLIGKQAAAAAAAITAKQATDNYGALALPAVAQWDPVANPSGVSDFSSFSPFFGYGSNITVTAPAAGSISALGVPSALGSTTNAAGAALVGVGDPATVVNSIESYDNEWVWHCHILGHEENDFMRAITTISTPVVPAAPTAVTASQSVAGQPVTISWTDPTPVAAYGTTGNATYGNQSNELGFLVQRSFDGGATWTTVTRVAANSTTATDPVPVATGATVTYQVLGYNAAGNGAVAQVSITGM